MNVEGWDGIRLAAYPRKRRKGVDSSRSIDRELRGFPEVPDEFRPLLRQ